MYLSEDDIEAIIRQRIEQDEQLGEQAGGSGHLADVSFQLNYISLETEDSNSIEVTCFYTLTVESEFTMYPSNPPRVYRYKKSYRINRDLVIMGESAKSPYSLDELPPEVAWPLVQAEILQMIEKYLFTIEWNYGEGRAPFHYPPEFTVENDPEGKTEFVCTLLTEDQPIERIGFRSSVPAKIIGLVSERL